jgi:putative component of toxin-antitoxin plasmid stabilization module
MARDHAGGGRNIPEPGHPLNAEHYSGLRRKIVFAKCNGGSEPAKQFYEELDEGGKDGFDNLFLLMGDHGKITNKEKFRHKVGSIRCDHAGSGKDFVVSEFKIHHGPGYRILAVLEGKVYVLTHGCSKPKDAQLPSEIERARKNFCEDRSRRRSSVVKGS